MRLFKAVYRDRHGNTRRSRRWYCEFRDHLEITRRIPLFGDAKASEETGRRIERLVALRLAGAEPDAELVRWLDRLEGRLVTNLARIGLLATARVSVSRPLDEHITAWAVAMTAKGTCERHRQNVERHVRRLAELCGWRHYTDITAVDVRDALAKLREKDIGAETSNHHLVSMKSFCRWMVREKLALSNPVNCLPMLGKKALKQDQRHPRRVVPPADIGKLLATTVAGPDRCEMTGPERALLYQLAVETGLRANELKTLRRQSLLLDKTPPVVSITDGATKNAADADIPLLPATAELLRAHTSDMLPTADVFHMPDVRHLMEMFKPDLAAAGIDYRDSAGHYFDFHSLRCCTATFLLDAGVSPKVVQEIMRHANLQTTMRYAKATRIEKRAEALTRMPNLEAKAEGVREATSDSVIEVVRVGTANSKQNGKTEGGYMLSASATTGSTRSGADIAVCPALTPQ